MKAIKLIFVLTCSVDLFAQKGDSVLCWDQHYKLVHIDFKGEADASSLYAGSCFSKLSVHPFLKADNKYTYNVKVLFFRYNSWVRDTSRNTIRHEQLHFDITELYGRKIRKWIKEKYDGNNDNELEQYVKTTMRELNKVQDDYDEETVHGAFKAGQKNWVEKICTELEQLKAFASTGANCTM